MKKKTRLCLTVFFVLIFLSFSLPAIASDNDFPITPVSKNGKKWRIGYLEGGNYVNYPINLRALVNGLAELGWCNPDNILEIDKEEDTGKIWQWLAKNVKSQYIEFVSDAYWSANWKKEERLPNKAAIIERTEKVKNIDLMLAMGTWAGQDLAGNIHVPTIVMSTSDPIRAKIIKSAEDSGFDTVHAKVDPTRYLRQMDLFHEIIGFKRLGIVYEDSIDGRTYAALEDIESVSKDKGFQIVSCQAPFSGVEKDKATQGIIKCHEELAPKVDAVYVTVHRGISEKYLPEILSPLYEHKIPTWSQRGSKYVKYGILMSISRADFLGVGRFHAEVIAKIFNGAKPRGIPQIFEDSKKIAINLATARKIEYNPPIDILGAADEIYEEIEIYSPKKK